MADTGYNEFMQVPSSRATLGQATSPRPFLEEKMTLRVRFQEADPLRIVWHGHYVGYFEEARRAFGRRYGIDYDDFMRENLAVPVVQLQVGYFAPANWSDELEISARLSKTDAARLEFEYEVRRVGETLVLARGSTVQVFTNPEGELMLTWPPFMRGRLAAWEPLWRQPAAI
jgi:acyl-CoA thioester hydrolase